jgi:signal transduction histidine kinase
MKLPRATVLILSSDPAFSRELTERWPKGAEVPEFVLLEQDLCRELRRDTYDLAIADAPSPERRANLRQALAAAGKPAIVIHSDKSADAFGIQGPILELRRDSGLWPAMPALLGREILRRTHAESRASESDRVRTAAEAEATLGRYMVEMRHAVNNALTSVLGNAELLLLEPGLPAPVLAQADTIRNMALRLNEVFQRFSSIEKELSVAARESGKTTAHARAAASGS